MTVAAVNFGDLAFYSGGFTLPKGRYALSFDALIHANTKNDGSRGVERLGIMLNAVPIDAEGNAIGEPQPQFLSMGSKAMQSFAPDPETGKSIVPIPGAPASTLPRDTNWMLFLKSLYDCGMESGVFTNDLTVLDGIWVLTDLVPEPEGRKSWGANTGEVQQERQGPQMIPVVSEILAKPWEGEGGMPEAAEEPKKKAGKPAPKAAPKAAAKPAAKVAPKAKPAPEPDGDEDAIRSAALNGVSAFLEKNPKGGTKLLLKVQTFAHAKKNADDETAQAVIDTFFDDDDALNGLLGDLGYKVSGGQVTAA